MNLTTVASAAAYQGIAATTPLLPSLVAAASSAALTYLSRDLFQTTYTDEAYEGTGTRRLILRQSPVTSVASVTVGNTLLKPAANPLASGYLFDSIGLWNNGWAFPMCPQVVIVTYTAGYPPLAVTDSPVAVPGSPYILTAQNLLWQSDVGVTYFVGGAPLARVTVSPAVGQYFVDGAGNYTFNAADTTASVVLSYLVLGIPAAITQAVNEMVGLEYKRRSNLDTSSKSIDGQSVSGFITAAMYPAAKQVLDMYKRVIPQL